MAPEAACKRSDYDYLSSGCSVCHKNMPFFRFSGVFIFWMSMLFHKNAPTQYMFTNPIFHCKVSSDFFYFFPPTGEQSVRSSYQFLSAQVTSFSDRAAAALRRALTQSGKWNVTANLRLHLFSFPSMQKRVKNHNLILPLVQMKHDWLRALKPHVHSKVWPSHRQKCTRSQTSQESHKQARTGTPCRVPSSFCLESVI